MEAVFAVLPYLGIWVFDKCTVPPRSRSLRPHFPTIRSTNRTGSGTYTREFNIYARADVRSAHNFILAVISVLLMSVINSACADLSSGQHHAAQGTWGGEHIRMDVFEKSVRIEYDCAFGAISRRIRLDEDGRFEEQGVHWTETGGPNRTGDPKRKRHPALYRGRITGDDMQLAVSLIESGKIIGNFNLRRDAAAYLEKCL